jgi:hypothetical protein
MIESSLRVRDDLVADSASYNMLMTTMLRAEVGRPVWGNWTLDPVVEPGMVGVVDPVSGIFELHKPRAIPLEVDVVEEVSPASWDYEGASVTHRRETGRPESWTFGDSHTIVSRGTHHSRLAIDDPVRAAAEHDALIRRYADARGYATGGRILQGFGIITATYQARDVVNLASRAPDQTFVLDAEVAPPADVEAFLHTGVAGRTAPETVPYAFEFLSFAGRTALPGWVGLIPAMSVSFHNSGSYVVQCTVAYDTPDARDLKKRLQVAGGIPGWVHLPLDATNLRVTCRFWHVDDWGPRHVLPAVANPMQQWHQGQGAVDIQGWWPADYDVAWAAA